MQGATNYNVYMSGCLGNAMFNGSNTLECFMDRWHREDLYDPESAWIREISVNMELREAI